MAQIRPALFIGLGTTGRDILEHLHDLMLEHYGSYTLSKLPIFKFVVFETHEGNSTKSKNIELEHLTITNTGYIKDHLGEKKYLTDWLDVNVLDVSGGKFTTGADNGRMAGRLCLWHNWDIIKKVLCGKGGNDKGAKSIIEPKNIDIAEDSLKEYYGKIGKKYDKGKGLIKDKKDKKPIVPIVYIVGTLYGGTCSGMFIDVAYFVKDFFGLYANNLPDVNLTPVRGFFTICDSSEIKNASDTQSKRRAANCWSALTEVDFWCHPKSTYEVEYPDGTKLKTNEDPIDSLYLISYSGPTVGRPLVSDFETLKHKIALNLFTEVVGDLLAAKDEIKTNTRSVVDLTKPNSNECMRFFGTFGIAAYWYPKYRISEAAASLYGEAEICEKWLGTKDIHANRKQELEGTAATFCEMIIKANKRTLTTTAEGFLKSQIPATGSKLDILVEGGVIDKIISNDSRRNTFRSAMVDGIENDITQKINGIKDSIFTLEEIIEYVRALDKSIKDTINKYSNYSLNRFKPDIWIRAVGRKKDQEEYELESSFERLVYYRLREPLMNVCETLGVSEELSESERRAGYRTIMQKLEAVKNVIVESKKRFEEKAEGVSKGIKTTEDIKVITKGRNLEEDIKDLLALLKTDPAVKADMITDILIRDDGTIKPLSEFLQYGIEDISHETVYKYISDSLTKISLAKIKGFDIANKILTSFDLPKIRLFVEHSEPHLELAGDLPSEKSAKPPELLMGKSSKLKEFNEKLDDYQFGTLVETDEIDHMLIFYKEEECLFRDTNLASAMIDNSYQKICDEIEEMVKEGKSGQKKGKNKKEEVPYTVFTHKRGKNYFDPNIYIRKEHAEELIDIAKDIFSTLDENGRFVSSEIFKNTGKFLKHEFKNPVIKVADDFRDDEAGINKIAQSKVIYDYFNDVIHNKIKELGKEGFIERLNNYLRWRSSFEEAKGKLSPAEIDEIKNEKREKYTHIMNDYFPEEKNT